MQKSKDILLRVNEELKQKIKERADSLGLKMASYIKMLITKDLRNQK